MTNYLELRPNDGRKSFYGKAKVRVDDGNTYTLISYNTEVARIRDGKLERLWHNTITDKYGRILDGYSATTARHVKAFCAAFDVEYGGKKEWDAL